MQRISYAGSSVVTGTDIAQAVLSYAQALAVNDSSETISIPVLLPDGERGDASILIGPASQLIAEPATGDVDEITDETLVQRLTQRTQELGPAHPVAETAESLQQQQQADIDLDFDLDSYNRPL
jgi:hypothetical protein